MANVDSKPVLSQLKSLGQAITGDMKGAKETQENFSKRCPVISQLRSAVEATALRNTEAARETQKHFLEHTVKPALETTPIVGHVTGGIYLAMGKNEKGIACIKAASKNTVVSVAKTVAELALTAAEEVEALTAAVEEEALTAAVEVEALTAAVEVEALTAAVEVEALTAAVEEEALTAAVEEEALTAAVEEEALTAAVEEEALTAAVESVVNDDDN